MSARRDRDEPLKALVFADSCGGPSLSPFQCTRTFLNLPVLSWQLAVLARYGVEEAIVLSAAPVTELYEDPLGRMKVTPLSSASWGGEGDAIRDVENHDGLRPADDFVLVRAGAVFNVNVGALVAQHKARREHDRNWLITTVLRKGAGTATTGLVVALDAATGTLIKYEEQGDRRAIAIDVYAESAGLQGGGVVEVCSDVVDLGLDVCAPEFLLEFRENFYYDSVRTYIKEKLEGGEAEVFGNRMFVHFLDSHKGEFGTRICSLASLAQATSDVLNGWMSPITVESIKGVSKEKSKDEYRNEFLTDRSLMEGDATVDVGSTIIESVIGSNVKIGSDVVVKHSIIMDGSVVGDRCDVERSIIEPNCTIDECSIIPRKCYLGSGVHIGPNFHYIAPRSFFTCDDPSRFQHGADSGSESEDDSSAQEFLPNGASKDSVKPDTSEDADVADGEENWDSAEVGDEGRGRLVDSSTATHLDLYFAPPPSDDDKFTSEEEDELEGEDKSHSDSPTGSRQDANEEANESAMDIESDLAAEDGHAHHDAHSVEKFNEELVETMERALSHDAHVDNTTLEVNSLKLVYHTSFAETLTGVLLGLAQWATISEPDMLYARVDSALHRFDKLVAKFNKVGNHAHQLNVASGLASALSTNGKLLMYLYKAMYERDMMDGETVLGWAAAERSRVREGSGNEDLLATLAPFLEWLEASDESEEDT